ncbi:MAG: hypothetical protein PVG88_01920, partial [Methyloceanibacter sp.]
PNAPQTRRSTTKRRAISTASSAVSTTCRLISAPKPSIDHFMHANAERLLAAVAMTAKLVPAEIDKQ